MLDTGAQRNESCYLHDEVCNICTAKISYIMHDSRQIGRLAVCYHEINIAKRLATMRKHLSSLWFSKNELLITILLWYICVK